MVGLELARVRRRTTVVLFSVVTLASTALFSTLTVAALVADEVMGLRALSGIPPAAAVAGTAIGSVVLSRLMARRGRRPGLLAGFLVAAGGAAAALVAAVIGSFPLLLVGMLAFGFGNSAALLGRFAAAEIYPVERRTSALGLILSASTIGAVVGPALVAPAGQLAVSRGLPSLGGAMALSAVVFAAAGLLCLALLRPDPSELAEEDPAIAVPPAEPPPPAAGMVGMAPAGAGAAEPGQGTAGEKERSVWRTPRFQMALATLVAGQFVMVLIMTMTPVHIRHHGHGLGTVSLVMSAHLLGMFGLTPVLGRLADRVGQVPVILLGLATLAVAGVMAAVAPPSSEQLSALALFLLGVGWSAGFVAGSGLLAHGASFAQRVRLQGSADSLVFAAAALASVGSGFLVASAGYVALCLVAAGIVVLPALVVLRGRDIAPAEPAPRLAPGPAAH